MKQTYTMMDYIQQIPKTALQNIEQYKILVEPLCNCINVNSTNTIWLIASGSSYNACMMAKPFMQNHLPCQVQVITPYTFINYPSKIKDTDSFIVVSQSGLSTNAIDAVKYIKQRGYTSIALTGHINSDIAKYASKVIEYGVGEELVGYVTKGVTTLALFLILFTIEKSGKIEYLDSLKRVFVMNREVIDKTSLFIEKHYKSFTSMHQCYLLGAGYTTGVCLEGALKIGELIHIPSNYYEIEEYIHGPNFQLTPNYTVLFFDNNDHTSRRVKHIYQATKAVTDHTFIITTNQEYKDDICALVINEQVDSSLLSLVYLPFIQIISFTISRDIHVKKQHPLMKEFNMLVSAKTDSYINYDEDL